MYLFIKKMAVQNGRKTRPNLKCGICGEHGGEPKSIAFCYNLGLDYVSCSPYRVPIARLSAAQAVLASREKKSKKRGVKIPGPKPVVEKPLKSAKA